MGIKKQTINTCTMNAAITDMYARREAIEGSPYSVRRLLKNTNWINVTLLTLAIMPYQYSPNGLLARGFIHVTEDFLLWCETQPLLKDALEQARMMEEWLWF